MPNREADLVSSLENYRRSDAELEREKDLMRLIGDGTTALDIGARDGHYSRLLTRSYEHVVALDLVKPDILGCENVAGDVTALDFPDRSFDLVFCTEVLEHISDVEKAAREIARVAKGRVVVGVPYRQDTRLGRVTCASCGNIDPPWGHVQEFDEHRLMALFPTLRAESLSFAGIRRGRTNALSTWLMDRAGNPWGTYDQEEPCSRCGSHFVRKRKKGLVQRLSSKVAYVLNRIQYRFTKPSGNWIHVLFTAS